MLIAKCDGAQNEDVVDEFKFYQIPTKYFDKSTFQVSPKPIRFGPQFVTTCSRQTHHFNYEICLIAWMSVLNRLVYVRRERFNFVERTA